MFLSACLISLAACGTKSTPTPTAIITPTDIVPTSTQSATITPGPSETPQPTDTPTPQPLGSQGNPIQIGFILPGGQGNLPPEADGLAQSLGKATGYTFQAKPLSNYPGILAGMLDGNVHLAFLPPFTYLQAKKVGAADVLLVAHHFGIQAYGAQFMANYMDGYTPFFDPANNKNLASASQALSQFAGKRPCLVDPISAAGYVVPLGILNQAGIAIQDPVISRSFDAVIRALFVRQICDFGATYAVSGDPRTASSILKDIPDAPQRIITIWQSPAVIPSLNVSVSAQLAPDLRQTISDALVKMAGSNDGQQMLSAANGNYEIDGLAPVSDDFYQALQSYVDSAAISLNDLMGY